MSENGVHWHRVLAAEELPEGRVTNGPRTGQRGHER